MARPKSMYGRKMLSLPAELWAKIDDFRFERRFRTEAEATRRLIERGFGYGEMLRTANDLLSLLHDASDRLSDEERAKLHLLEALLSDIRSEQALADFRALDERTRASILEEAERAKDDSENDH